MKEVADNLIQYAVHVFRIAHPDPGLFNNPHLFQKIVSALKSQNADQLMHDFRNSEKVEKEMQSLILQAAKAQFQVLKETLTTKGILILEHSHSADIRTRLQYFGSYIREAFLQLPERFSELNNLQRMILMILPLHYIIPAINSEKILCPAMIGSEQEYATFLVHANMYTEHSPLENDIFRQMNIIHAVSVCLVNKMGLSVDLVTGALHDTDYLRCFIGDSHTESFYPNKDTMKKMGIEISQQKHFSSDQCKKDMELFLQKWPSYQRFISFCFGNVSKSEAEEIKDEYMEVCRSMTRIEPSFTTQLVSSTYGSFTSAVSDEYAELFNSMPEEWSAWLALQFCFSLVSELASGYFNHNDITSIIKNAMTALLLLSLVRIMVQISSKSLSLMTENMSPQARGKIEPILLGTKKAALSVYASYSVFSNPISIPVGFFSGYCGRELVRHLVSPQQSNEDGNKRKMK